jgi:signal transduction histidine kinase
MLRASGFARVLEAFYTTKPGDLGFGLLIFQSNIEAQNGRLWASSNVSRGAIFGFVAPTHAAAASCGGVPASDPPYSRQRVQQSL